MADRYPLIANSATNKIEELADGDNLNLDGNDIVNVLLSTYSDMYHMRSNDL